MTTRLRAIDAARGTAMLFVCLSHFILGYFGDVLPTAAFWLRAGSMVASPAFMIISGSMLGLLYGQRPADFAGTSVRLRERALFLLTIGHLLILVPHIPRHGLAGLPRLSFITDVVALGLLAGTLLVTRLAPRRRAALGAALYAVGWIALARWHPLHAWSGFLKETLVGPHHEPTFWRLSVPWLPWLGIYLASTALGEWMAGHHRAGTERRFRRAVLAAGGTALGAALVLKLGWIALRRADVLAASSREVLEVVASPWSKVPPSPIYLMTFGGMALMVLGTVLELEARGWATRFVAWTALLGRNSLFVFLLQFYVYYLAVPLLGRAADGWWLVPFAATLVVMTALTRQWDARGLNRHLRIDLGLSPRVGIAARRESAAT